MQMMKKVILMALFVLQLHAENWKLVKQKDGIDVYTKKVEGSDFLAFKSVIYIEGSVDAVVALLYDIPATSEWINDCNLGMTIAEKSFNENYIFQTFDMPFPVSNRQLILHSRLRYRAYGAELDSEDANGFCKNREDRRCLYVKSFDYINISKSKGHYEIRRLSENKTKIIWTLQSEPGGSIPQWLANVLVVDIPFYSLSKLREMVKRPKYRDKSRAEIQALWQEEYDKFH